MNKDQFFQFNELDKKLAETARAKGIMATIRELQTEVPGLKLRESYDIVRRNYSDELREHDAKKRKEIEDLENSPEALEFYRNYPNVGKTNFHLNYLINNMDEKHV